MLLLFILFNFSLNTFISPGHHAKTLNNLYFGSCFNGFFAEDLGIFETITENHSPDLFLWIGDAIYADKGRKQLNDQSLKDGKINSPYIKGLYETVKQIPSYAKLEKSTFISGIYDDHDFGYDNSNSNFPHGEDFKQEFLNFINTPEDDFRREKGRGAYFSLSFGEKGSYKSVRIIVTDTRYYKTSPYGSDRDMLGEEQWKWLEEELQNDDTFTLIVSGTQFLPMDKMITESWFAESRDRLFKLLGKHKKSGVLLLSGDIHMAEILRTHCVHPKIGYHLFEVTSSGLSEQVPHFFPFMFNVLLPNRYGYADLIHANNFASVNLNWGKSKEDSSMRFNIFDSRNNTRFSKELKWTDLKYGSQPSEPVCEDRINSRFRSFEEIIAFYSSSQLHFTYIPAYLGAFTLIFAILKGIIFLLKFVFSLISRLFCVKQKKD